jgi:NADH-quinone oxidoreductase subunit J
VDVFLFYLFGGVAVVASLAVIGQRNAMHSVLLLIAAFIGLAGLYILLDAPFAAVTQIIVYGGAIMVLFLFVVMLLNMPIEPLPAADPTMVPAKPFSRRLGVAFAVMLIAELSWALARSSGAASGRGSAVGVSSVREIGVTLFTDYAFAFEATSILILVSMVGAVVLAKRHI